MDQNVSIVASVALLIYFILAMVSRSKYEKIPFLKYSVIWIGIFLALTFLYSFKDTYHDVKDRIIGELVPSAVIEEDGLLTVRKSTDGHFYMYVHVNDKRIKFMVDTGASDVVMTKSDAKKIGIDLSALKFNKVYNTANGRVYGASALTESFVVGSFVLNDFEISVNSGNMRTSLLGMSYLREFDFYKFEGDTLYLKY